MNLFQATLQTQYNSIEKDIFDGIFLTPKAIKIQGGAWLLVDLWYPQSKHAWYDSAQVWNKTLNNIKLKSKNKSSIILG